MKAGRIETYVHSDLTTANKGVGVVKVLTETDFAARDQAFIGFTRKLAMVAYIVGAKAPGDLFVESAEEFELAKKHLEICEYLGEDIKIDEVWSSAL